MTPTDLIIQAAQARAQEDLQNIVEATSDVATGRILFARLFDAVIRDVRSSPLYTLAWRAYMGEHAGNRAGDPAITEHITRRPITGQFDQVGSDA